MKKNNKYILDYLYYYNIKNHENNQYGGEFDCKI